MHYIVALGNPGEEYALTRHNVGWLMLDYLCAQESFSKPEFDRHHHGRITQGMVSGKPVAALYPDTYMNHSGLATRTLVPQGELSQLLVLHDDIALPLGEIKVSVGRGHGGHNGIKSLIAHLGTEDFARVRIGIAQKTFLTGALKRPSGEALPKFVTAPFTKGELASLEEVAPKVLKAVQLFVSDGAAIAMNYANLSST